MTEVNNRMGRNLCYDKYKGLPVPEGVTKISELQLGDKQLVFLNAFVKNKFILRKTILTAKIGRQTFYDWKEEYPHFVKALDICRDKFVDEIESSFAELVHEKNPQAVIFGLRTLGRHKGYAEKQEIEHSGIESITVSFGSDKPKILDAEVIEQ